VHVVRATPPLKILGLLVLDGLFVAAVVEAMVAREPDLVRAGAGVALAVLGAAGLRWSAHGRAARRPAGRR